MLANAPALGRAKLVPGYFLRGPSEQAPIAAHLIGIADQSALTVEPNWTAFPKVAGPIVGA
jgi:hypothetical protein